MSKLGSRVVSLAVSLVLAMAPAAGASGSAASPVVGDAVYAASNGVRYHRADCPRLHLGKPLSREEARKRLTPCPVCKPDAEVATPAPALVTATATPAVAEPVHPATVEAAREAPAPVATERKKSHRMRKSGRGAGPVIGAAVGGLVGAAAGFVLAFAIVQPFDEDGNGTATTFYGIWLGSTAAGVVGGYAIGGGFRDVDAALRQEQDRFRSAHLGEERDIISLKFPDLRVRISASR